MRVLTVCPELPRADCPGSMAPTARQIQSLRDCGVETEVLDMRGIPKLKYLQAIPRIRRLAKSVDLVHAHFGYCGWLSRLQLRKPIVLSFMGSDVYGDTEANGRPGLYSATMSAINRKLLARVVSAIIVKSQMMADLVAPLPTTVIANGVDIDMFRPLDRATMRQQLGLDQTKRYLLFPGNPENPRKGYAFAESVMQRFAQSGHNDVELIKLWGILPEQVPVYMNACNAMLMVSFAEGSPNVVKEAMACNVPVVAVPVGDVAELLTNIPGNAVRPRDAEQVFNAAAELLMDQTPSAGRQRIFDLRLDLPSVAQRVIAIYHKVLAEVGEVATQT